MNEPDRSGSLICTADATTAALTDGFMVAAPERRLSLKVGSSLEYKRQISSDTKFCPFSHLHCFSPLSAALQWGKCSAEDPRACRNTCRVAFQQRPVVLHPAYHSLSAYHTFHTSSSHYPGSTFISDVEREPAGKWPKADVCSQVFELSADEDMADIDVKGCIHICTLAFRVWISNTESPR